MSKLEEMWAALEAYQPTADANGHGESWAGMCKLKTYDAAYAAVDAAYAADAAYAYAAYAAYAAAATNASIAAADIADAEKWVQRAISHMNKLKEKP